MESSSLESYSDKLISTEVACPNSFLTWHKHHRRQVRADSVIEVYSIHISFNDDQEAKYCGYGSIWVEDSKESSTSKRCVLYRRLVGDKDLDLISFHPNEFNNKLTLIGPDNVISMIQPKIFIDIMDSATGLSIVKGSDFLHNATTDVFEKEHHLTIQGQGLATAHVKYIALKFGLAAVLEFKLFKDPEGESEDDPEGESEDDPEGESEGDPEGESESDSDDESIDIYGSISAYYNNAYCGRQEGLCIKLFEKPYSESHVVTFGSPIDLSRSLVVLPAYSSIIIDFDLRDRATTEPIVNEKVTLETITSWNEDVLGQWQSRQILKMRLTVLWKEPVMLDESSYDTGVASCLWCRRFENHIVIPAFEMLEILSVIINPLNDEELSLYGTIDVLTAWGMCNIFTATKEDPYRLRSGCRRIPLKYPSRCMTLGDVFSVNVDLMDVNWRIYIKGSATSSYGFTMAHKSWFDRRLCSVVKGAHEKGFAAVNYMVMTRAIRAVVKVDLLSKGVTGLYGKIVAFYGKYPCMTEDDREYYRCVLFERSEGTTIENTEVKLSRSVLPVPLDSSLLVEVDLKLKAVRGVVEHLQGTATFQPKHKIFSSVDIKGSRLAIRVSVEWCDPGFK